MKIDAVSFSWAGDKYIGRSYKEMDCQAFVERCMADSGLRMDLAGSNAWIREVKKHGWIGTPEECVKVFGKVPTGALLFILLQDGNEPAKYRGDGIGNASHIGIVTHRNDGAIHSSSSRGCVATSVFKDKTIRGGGWNCIGLYDKFDYGKSVNWVLEHIGIGPGPEPEPDPAEKEPDGGGTVMIGKVVAEKGSTVKLRQEPSTSCRMYWDIPVGTEIEIIKQKDAWTKVRAGSRVGWMKNEFIQVADLDAELPDPETEISPADDELADDFTTGDVEEINDGTVTVMLKMTQDEAATLLPIIDRLQWNLVQIVGARG